jgi:P4 family phage/plasmid primase-like protien
MKKIRDILKKTFVDPELYDYFQRIICEVIRGKNTQKAFNIWTGKGDNGKSVIAKLVELSLGDYFFTAPETLLTSRSVASANATPELFALKGARICCMSETGKTDVLNCGLMKKLSGGDAFYARGLFKEPVKIIPHFQLLLHCNYAPSVSPEDFASWNRINVLPFESTFSSYADKDPKVQRDEKIFEKKRTLMDELDKYKEAFMSLLIHTFEKQGDMEIVQPEKVKLTTLKYKQQNDFYEAFFSEKLTTSDDAKDHVCLAELYVLFKEWFKDGYPSQTLPTRVSFKEAMNRKYGLDTKGYWHFMKQVGQGEPGEPTLFSFTSILETYNNFTQEKDRMSKTFLSAIIKKHPSFAGKSRHLVNGKKEMMYTIITDKDLEETIKYIIEGSLTRNL